MSLLREAVEIKKSSGDKALLEWYEQLPPERKREFLNEACFIVEQVTNAFDRLKAQFGGMAMAMSQFALGCAAVEKIMKE